MTVEMTDREKLAKWRLTHGNFMDDDNQALIGYMERTMRTNPVKRFYVTFAGSGLPLEAETVRISNTTPNVIYVGGFV